MNQYQNTAFESGKSTFVDTQTKTELTFQAKDVNVPVPGGRVPMVKGFVLARQATSVDLCSNECPAEVTGSVKVEFNHITGDVEAIKALRAEVIRVMDAALEEFGLEAGLVPPAYARFQSE